MKRYFLAAVTAFFLLGAVVETMALSDYQTRVDDLVRDQDNRISDAQRDLAIQDAVRHYGGVRPRTVVEDVTGAGSRTLALPSGWADSSRIISVEYPVGEMPPELAQDWYRYQPPGKTAAQLVMPEQVPADAIVRITFTAPHKLMVTLDTIPAPDAEAVAYYAAATLCDQLAAVYAGSGDATIASDSVDHESRTDYFLRLAREYRALYGTYMGVPTPGRGNNAAAGDAGNRVRPAGAVTAIGDDRRWLTHDADGMLYPGVG